MTKNETSNAGRPSFDRLMMFKILRLQELYGLSDDQIEFQLLDRLSFQKFIGQGLNNRVPDAKTIWLFRNTLTKSGVIELLFIKLGKQLERHGLIAKRTYG
ncbi:MAG: transposase [Bacteroidetes bacterium]|nr:transposase [Bacteroidota bacterium]